MELRTFLLQFGNDALKIYSYELTSDAVCSVDSTNRAHASNTSNSRAIANRKQAG